MTTWKRSDTNIIIHRIAERKCSSCKEESFLFLSNNSRHNICLWIRRKSRSAIRFILIALLSYEDGANTDSGSSYDLCLSPWGSRFHVGWFVIFYLRITRSCSFIQFNYKVPPTIYCTAPSAEGLYYVI